MKGRCLVFAIAVALIPGVAGAQAGPQGQPQPGQPQGGQPQPHPTPDSLNGAVGGLWNSVSAQLQAALTEYARVYAELQKAQQEKRDLDAYLKSCGDHPGCTQPMEALPARPAK